MNRRMAILLLASSSSSSCFAVSSTKVRRVCRSHKTCATHLFLSLVRFFFVICSTNHVFTYSKGSDVFYHEDVSANEVSMVLQIRSLPSLSADPALVENK
jgi:hypothetical protein